MRLRTLLITAALGAAVAVDAAAQATTGPAVLYADPGSRKLATIAAGTVLTPGSRSGAFVQVTLRGFVARSLLDGKRDSFAVSVNTADVLMRAAPNSSARVVASLQQGLGLHLVRRAGTWAEVRRSGWVRRSALPAVLAADPAQPPKKQIRRPPADPPAPAPARASVSKPSTPQAHPPQAADTTPQQAAPEAAMTPVKSGGLSPAPNLGSVATVAHGAVLIPLARDRGWVRVRLDGWMRESDLQAADSTMALVTAADLQASPTEYVGRTVRWAVTSLAFQTADALRKDMRPDEPYLLARGPGDETTLLYLALPPDLVDRAKALPPMAQIVITARVRTGSSQPSGVPILDVLSLAKR